jgi:hypothetical protein
MWFDCGAYPALCRELTARKDAAEAEAAGAGRWWGRGVQGGLEGQEELAKRLAGHAGHGGHVGHGDGSGYDPSAGLASHLAGE